MSTRRHPNRAERAAKSPPQHPDWERPLPPLYYRVFRTLEQRIRDRCKPDDRLPSEDQLCREFKVSRITIRQAVGRLVELGLVTRRRGSGTFVAAGAADAETSDPVKFTAALEDLFAHVETVRTKSAEITEETVPADVAKTLGIPKGEKVSVVRRVRSFRDQIFSLTTNYLPRHLGARLAESDLYRYPLLQLLEEKLHVALRFADQTVEARLADEDVAKALAIHFGDPVLFVERLMFVDADRPFEVVRSYYRADVYRLQIHLARGQKAPFRWRVAEDSR